MSVYSYVVNYGYEAIFKDVVQELEELHKEREGILCYRVQQQIFSGDNLPALIYVGPKSALSAGKFQDIAQWIIEISDLC